MNWKDDGRNDDREGSEVWVSKLLLFRGQSQVWERDPSPSRPPSPFWREAWLHCKHRDETFPEFGTKIEISNVEIIFSTEPPKFGSQTSTYYENQGILQELFR